MIRIEGVGDWMVIRGETTWVSTGSRYSLEFDARRGRGKLHVQPSSDPTDDRVELSFAWPSSERGHLLLADHNQPQRIERLGVVQTPSIVRVSATGEDSKPVEFSGFQLFSVPDEPAQRVLPVEQVTFALRDGGELATRIENDSEAPPEPPRDQAELGRQLSERIRDAHPEARVEMSDATLLFESSDGARQNISLENAWARVQGGETDVLERYLELVAESISASNDAAPIFPLLKPAGTAVEFFADARRIAERDGGKPEPLLSTPITDGLECLYVFDRPHGMQFLTAADLRTGLSQQELPAHAVERLNESLTTILRIEVQPGVHMLTCGGNYEVSLLLLPEVWAEVDGLLDGQRVVSIPNRDLLFVTGSNNRKGLEWMRQNASEGPSRSYPIITDLLLWNGTLYEVLPAPKKGWLRRLFQ